MKYFTLRIAIAILWGGLLVGCGGSGNTDEEPGRATSVAFAQAVPVAARTAITTIDSSAGSATKEPSSGEFRVRTSVGRELILALNGEGDIMLATVSHDIAGAPRASVTLSAETTAKALTTIYGGAGLAEYEAELDTLLPAAPGYSDLLAAIRIALDAGESPAAAKTVAAAGLKVVQQVAESVAARQTSSGKSRALAVSPPYAFPVPFKVFPNPYELFREQLVVSVTDQDFQQGIAVQNASPLIWSVKTESHDGRELQGSPLKVPGTSISQILLNKITPWDIIPKTKVPGDGGNAIWLTVEQTLETQTDNVYNLLEEIVLFIFKKIPASTCSSTIAKDLGEIALLELKSGGNAESVFLALSNFATNPTVNINIIAECADSSVAPEWEVAQLRRIKAITRALSIAGKVFDGLEFVSIASRMALLYAQFNDTFKISVCLGAVATNQYRITSCAKTIESDPAVITMAVGAKTKLSLTAKDWADVLTLLPASMQFTRVGGLEATTPFTFSPQTRQIEATQEGFSGIGFNDEPTLAKGSVGITVIKPVIAPQAPQLKVGSGAVAFSLRAPDGGAVLLPDGIVWDSSDTSVLERLPGTSLFGPLKKGSANVEATMPNGTKYTTEVTVVDDDAKYDKYIFEWYDATKYHPSCATMACENGVTWSPVLNQIFWCYDRSSSKTLEAQWQDFYSRSLPSSAIYITRNGLYQASVPASDCPL